MQVCFGRHLRRAMLCPMRIIGGVHRSRTIASPPGDQITRPITDRVKQSLFDRLMAMSLPDADGSTRVLDLFAGTGSLGLEALSRGAGHCTFVERNRAVRRLLEQNLSALDLDEQSLVLGFDLLATNWQPMLNGPYDLIFCDPPYALTDAPAAFDQIQSMLSTTADVTDAGGVLVLRIRREVAARTIEPWRGPDSHGYGSMTLHFYELAAC